jgi:signal transduction histidine kinase
MKDIIFLIQDLTFTNLDLLSVGITIAAIALLGFIVYISNPKSATSISFLFFCLVTMLWSFFNYISYQTEDPDFAIILWRLVIFFGTWHAFSFFNFLYVFPRETASYPFWYKYLVIPYIFIISCLALFTGFVFTGISIANETVTPIVNYGIVVFAVSSVLLVLAGLFFSIKGLVHAKKDKKKVQIVLLVGIIITLVLLLTNNVILPIVFGIISFTKLGAVSLFPFAAFTAYAIFKHKAFKVRNLGAALMAFFLCSATFVEIIFAETPGKLILRAGIFLFVLLISIQFVKNIFMLEAITERLEKANDQLKSLDVLKSEFISLASHQLRSPLTVIKGYASTLTDGIVGDLNDKQREIANHIYSSAQGLASMVEEFLNVSKIEQGGMKYSFERVDLSPLVASLAEEMKTTADDKHLVFSITGVADGMYMVQADAVKLRQVFLNLIDNSVKYTQEGFVKVSLEKKAGAKGCDVVVTISDSGIGISDETKKKLFTKFGRGEEVSRHSGGSGLGLYLAQEVVKAHHGAIHVQSKGLHLGSSFSVSLPCVS